MIQDNEINQKELEKQDDSKVDELGGFYFSSSIKITDPNTKEVLVQVRGDQ
jgi:hypothetical protein